MPWNAWAARALPLPSCEACGFNPGKRSKSNKKWDSPGEFLRFIYLIQNKGLHQIDKKWNYFEVHQ